MKKYSAVFIFLLCVSFAYAGDIAQYINLGFSGDSETFMFGQYGINSENSRAYADFFIVDVSENKFISDGVQKRSYPDQIMPGQNGLGALISLLEENTVIIKKAGINHVASGRVVYLLVNGAEPKEKLEFRDFYKGGSYTVTLKQETFGSGETVSSSFHIVLDVKNKDNTVRTYTIGLPNFKREGVIRYRIKQIVFTPSENGLVFVIEKELSGSEGKSIRYMVETLTF